MTSGVPRGAWGLAAAAVAAFVFAAAPASAEMPGESEADVPVQKEAMDALDRMAAHLRTLKQFRLTAATTFDDILDTGELIEITGETTVEARVPDRLKAHVVNDKQDRVYFYNGTTVTQYAPLLEVYSVFDAPDTIAGVVQEAESKYGLRLPLADIFLWGSDKVEEPPVELAYFAGETMIGGNLCDHYAYRVPWADVQIWMRASGDPLPCRLVVIDTDEESRPQKASTFVWDTDVDFPDSIFEFAPPPGVGEIEQEPVSE